MDQKHNTKLKVFGNKLKESIEEKQVSLDELSKATKIRKVIIESILNGDGARLPAPIFVIGYIRAILDYLKVDSYGFIEEFKRLSKEEEEKIKEETIHLNASNKTSKQITLLIVFILLMVVFSAIYLFRFSSEERVFSKFKTKILKKEDLKPKFEEKKEIKSENLTFQGEVKENKIIEEDSLYIEFNSNCWTEIYDEKGKTLAKNQYKGGESVKFEGKKFFLVIGDSSAVNVFIGGKELPLKKEKGKVLKVWVTSGEKDEPSNS